MEQNPKEWHELDLFPKAPKEETGIRMQTWHGFEIVLPEALVTPDPNYAQTAPNADVGPQKRRLQSPPKENTLERDVAGGIGGAISTANASWLSGIAGAAAQGIPQAVEQPSWLGAIGSTIATVATVYMAGILNRRI